MEKVEDNWLYLVEKGVNDPVGEPLDEGFFVFLDF